MIRERERERELVRERERDIKEWYLVEDPDLAVVGRSRYSVAVVVEEHSLILGVAAQRDAQLLDVVHRGIEALLVASARLPSFILCACERA